MDSRISNGKQVVSAYEIEYKSGKEKGISGVLVNVGELEVFFNENNALDISFVKFKGNNISFLSKNGLNTNRLSFEENFEGGFLYTCGLDNVSSCVENCSIHGSLHYKTCQGVYFKEYEDRVVVGGFIDDTKLFGKFLRFTREYTVYNNRISICDTVENLGTKDENYVLLYHTNFGYPFLDEGLKLNIPAVKSIPLTDIAKKREKEKFDITFPVNENPEDVYYHYLSKGEVNLKNEKLNLSCKMRYSTKDFPLTLEWKSMKSSDYALGIEPSLTRFDEFKMRTLKPNKNKKYKIDIDFE